MDRRPLSSDDQALLDAAAQVIHSNYRHRRHTVGSAVRCGSGRVYTGVNVDSCGYGPCAEPVTIGAAISQGEREIETIVAVAGKEGKRVIAPCGNCRQLLADYAPEAMVILSDGDELFKVRAIDLLPEAYLNFE